MPMPPSTTSVWNDALLSNPHAVADKQSRVRRMFAAIAGSYDINNHLHSLWMDQHWRSRAVAMANLRPGDAVLDCACGTGDLTLKFARRLRALSGDNAAETPRVIGLDYTFEMLPLAAQKSARQAALIAWMNGDAMNLPLPDACVDVVSIAFGIRNVANPQQAIREFFRVLRPGGRLIILEFSLPQNPLLKAMYNFYFRRILPVTATLISGDRTGAYKYLPESVNTFIGRSEMLSVMQGVGFADTCPFPLTFGVCVCYRGVKSA